MRTERRVVDNRVFLLGLDQLYREAVKKHERGELLQCARRVAAVLGARPADVPVEGYYAEDERLTEYFRLVRALQDKGADDATLVDHLPEFRRLRDVMSAPLYGRPGDAHKLLPMGRDSLYQALAETYPEWTVPGLTAVAARVARATDDISLVGLAARAEDPVVIAATRESVVLYAGVFVGAALDPPHPEYVWEVDEDLARQASRFIDTFHALFGGGLPPAEAAQAERYWHAYKESRPVGRCVRIGSDDSTLPVRHYHWAICRAATGEFVVQEFWKHEVWTTARYRSALRPPCNRCRRA